MGEEGANVNAGDCAHTRPFGPDTHAAFALCFEEVNHVIKAVYSHVPPDVQEQVLLIKPATIETAFALLQSLVVKEPKTWPTLGPGRSQAAWRPIYKFLERPEVELIHFVRLMVMARAVWRADDGLYRLDAEFDRALHQFRKHRQFGLRDLGEVFRRVGLDPRTCGEHQLRARYGDPFPWPAADVWPYWQEHLDVLDDALQPTTDDWLRGSLRNGLKILAKFPEPPEQFNGRLWHFAFGDEPERDLAQNSFGSSPALVNRIAMELSSTEPNRRIIAAEWLARLRQDLAIAPLIRSARQETSQPVKRALLIALEQLNVPLDEFLDRDALGHEAERGLAKGMPEELNWFPFADLPKVHWSGDTDPISPSIVQWWLVHSFRSKNPEPGPLLRGYCGAIVQEKRQALGQFVLETWIAQESYTRRGPLALTCKGLLAVAAACCGGAAVPPVRQYLAKWFKPRAGQCRALVQMLAWIDHPAAVQLLLSVASSFRPKTIEAEARRLTTALAERKGWTIDEMADRSIPSAGLDDKGEMELSYGPRRFTVRLDPQTLDLVLLDAGKILKGLPKPRKDEDPDLAAKAKRDFLLAKKELKSVLQIQRHRLYESMCIGRTWRFSDWNLYLNRHPIMRYLCQRLVWSASRDGQMVTTFRTLPDGSLTDFQDTAVQLLPGDRVALPHQSNTSDSSSRAWQKHFADYAVEPIFPQFGIEPFVLSPEQREQTELTDLRGHMIYAFSLRSKAGQLGYTRGRPEDGGFFYHYLKAFPSLGITAIIGFTGNAIPEENRQVALTELYFESTTDPGRSPFGSPPILLSDIPAVLLSECWNDMRKIAAAGSGFDPEWEQKAQI